MASPASMMALIKLVSGGRGSEAVRVARLAQTCHNSPT